MVNVAQRKEDVLELVSKLDISPSMFEAAKERYTNLGRYLQQKDSSYNIYPQGSFALGTVTRPINKPNSFDLDFIVENMKTKNTITPKEAKLEIKSLLVTNEIYKNRLDPVEYDKCWTLIYNDEFSMDIVPSVPSDIYNTFDTSIEITNKVGDKYEWFNSNPKLYIEWFNDINDLFKIYSRENQRNRIFKETSFYSSIEEIPEELIRSSLQRTIQIIKRHRDIYYDRRKKTHKKPTSAILTTLSAQIAQKEINKSIGVFELLTKIVETIEINTKKRSMTYEAFDNLYGDEYNQIQYTEGKWYLPNPINSSDNLADTWNTDYEIVSIFKEWLKQLKKDFGDSLKFSDEAFFDTMNNSFGGDFVKTNIDEKKYRTTSPRKLANTPKPWRE